MARSWWSIGRRTQGRHALGAAVTELPSGPPAAAKAPLVLAVPPRAPAPVLPAAPAESSLLVSIAELIASGEAWSDPTAAASVAEQSVAAVSEVRAPQPSRRPADPPAVVVPPAVVLLEGRVPVVAVDLRPGALLMGAPAPRTAADDALPGAAPAVPALLSPVSPPTVALPAVAEPAVPPPAEPAPEALPVAVQPVAVQPVAVQPVAVQPLAVVLPSGPPAEAADGQPVAPPPEPGAAEALSAVLAQLEQAVPAPEVSFDEPVVPPQSGPRVNLGFRDGSSASLDPDSEQAQALAELSELLTGRD